MISALDFKLDMGNPNFIPVALGSCAILIILIVILTVILSRRKNVVSPTPMEGVQVVQPVTEGRVGETMDQLVDKMQARMGEGVSLKSEQGYSVYMLEEAIVELGLVVPKDKAIEFFWSFRRYGQTFTSKEDIMTAFNLYLVYHNLPRNKNGTVQLADLEGPLTKMGYDSSAFAVSKLGNGQAISFGDLNDTLKMHTVWKGLAGEDGLVPADKVRVYLQANSKSSTDYEEMLGNNTLSFDGFYFLMCSWRTWCSFDQFQGGLVSAEMLPQFLSRVLDAGQISLIGQAVEECGITEVGFLAFHRLVVMAQIWNGHTSCTEACPLSDKQMGVLSQLGMASTEIILPVQLPESNVHDFAKFTKTA